MNYADLFNTIFAKDHLVQELGYFFVNEPSGLRGGTVLTFDCKLR